MAQRFANMMPSGRMITALQFAAGAGAVGWAGYNSLYNVEGGHRAIIYSRFGGIQEEIKGEGTHILMPWFHRPYIYDIRTRPRSVQSLTGSKDLQMVNINLRVLSRPKAESLPYMYRVLGTDWDERVLPSIVNEVLKQVVAQFNAAQMLTQRAQVSALIGQNLKLRAQEFNIIIEDVSIIDLTFGREFTAAVEAKQVAQQDAERAKFIVERALQEKRSTIIKAQGDATSAALIGASVRENPAFLQLRRIDAAREIANTVARGGNKMYLNADSLLMNLNVETGANERLDSKKKR